jgi:YVTN family beta-propeller protein
VVALFPRVLGCLLSLSLINAGCRNRRAPPRPYLAFVANQQSSAVAVVELATLRVLREIPVPAGPSELAVRPGSQEVWAVSGGEAIAVIRVPQLDVRATLHLGLAVRAHEIGGAAPSPRAPARTLVFSPDGRKAFVFLAREASVVFVDCSGPREIGRVRLNPAWRHLSHRSSNRSGNRSGRTKPGEPEAEQARGAIQSPAAAGQLAIMPDGKTLVVSDPAANKIHFMSVDSQKLLGSLEVGRSPSALATQADGSKVFVADTGEEKISAVDAASRKVLSHIEIGVKPGALLMKPDGGELLVLSSSSTLVIIDAFHDNVEQNFPLGRDPLAAAIKRDQSVLYVADAGQGSVMAIDVPSRRPLSSTQVGASPVALALTPDERFLLVADHVTSSLAILRTDLAENPQSGPVHKDRSALVSTVPVGLAPVDVVVPNWLSESP